MIDNLIYVDSLSAPKVDEREVLRYAGVRESDSATNELLKKCIVESWDKLSYKVCYRVFDLSAKGDELDLGFAQIKSHALAKRLDGCEKILLFCATIGSDIDRLIAKYNVLSPSTAVILQALGSERVEALCDVFCEKIGVLIAEKGYSSTTRFSPGYGDLPLELQINIFDALECPKDLALR